MPCVTNAAQVLAREKAKQGNLVRAMYVANIIQSLEFFMKKYVSTNRLSLASIRVELSAKTVCLFITRAG